MPIPIPAPKSGSGSSLQKPGSYEVRLAYQNHENRGSRVPVIVRSADGEKEFHLDMREAAPLEKGFVSLGEYRFTPDSKGGVLIGTADSGGNSHADAVQFLPVE